MEISIGYNNKKEWNNFIAANSHPAAFSQSYEWGEFNEKILGQTVKRIAVMEDEKIKVAFSTIKKKMFFSKYYYYAPRGPISTVDYQDKKMEACIKVYRKTSSEFKDAIFLRVCPPAPYKNYLEKLIKKFGCARPSIMKTSTEPEHTILLDLTKNEERLLSLMHQKTRYNIRLAEKKGVTIRKMMAETVEQDSEIFYDLSREMAERNKVRIYDKEYYRKMIKFFFKAESGPDLKLYIAEYKSRPIAAIMVIYFGDTATYLHGASNNKSRELMPNYLLQWTAIKEAKEAGMQIYDFWGIDEKRWQGITRFKRGFGGEEIRFIGTWDQVINKPWYLILTISKIIKNFF